MAVYAIADLHLSGAHPKTMDIFGSHWENHWQKIQSAWSSTVCADDLVLLPGDISWAMTLEDALVDIREIAALPGQMIMMRGNHDYWWSSQNKMKQAFPPNIFALHNNCYEYQGRAICGTRGWLCPEMSQAKEDLKIYNREAQRLKLSLDAAKQKGMEIFCVMTHFPPFSEKKEENAFTDLFQEYGVKTVVYGHLHGRNTQNAFSGMFNGIEYHLVSCDHLHFHPKRIFE